MFHIRKNVINDKQHIIMRRVTLSFIITICAIATAAAQEQTSVRDAISHDKCLSGSNYLAYPGPSDATLTPAPAGYEPFYISHYGRHGSRYLLGADDYDYPTAVLAAADSLGKLTPTGRSVLARVTLMQQEALDRYGELTAIGAAQLRDIARRMYDRFPQVFAGEAVIDAKSTVVIRCILSMENVLQQLIALNPELKITHDASQHDMYYMNLDDKELQNSRMPDSVTAIYNGYRASRLNCSHALRQLFNDSDYMKDADIDTLKLANKLLMLASNVQNTALRDSVTLYDIFTVDELYGYWMTENAWWYINFGPYKLNGGTQPYSQRNLLRAIIADADEFIDSGESNGADLRFGHESMVLPLTCLLGINGFDMQTASLDSLESRGWINYEVYPMASNIQLIFYRNAGDDILIKVLLNENEASLPLNTDIWPYYKWDDFKQYYLSKLRTYDESR